VEQTEEAWAFYPKSGYFWMNGV